MSTKDRIEIDFAKAVARAESLEKMAGYLSEAASEELTDAINAIAGIWSGDNADRFIKKGMDYIPGILATADELLKMADNVRYTATVIYEAEKKAIGMI